MSINLNKLTERKNFCKDVFWEYKSCLLDKIGNKEQRERDDKINNLIQRTIDHCGQDQGCKEELLGGFYRASSYEYYRCESAETQVNHCIITNDLDENDLYELNRLKKLIK